MYVLDATEINDIQMYTHVYMSVFVGVPQRDIYYVKTKQNIYAFRNTKRYVTANFAIENAINFISLYKLFVKHVSRK